MSTEAMDTELRAMRRALEALAARFSPDTAAIEPTDIQAATAFVWRPEQHRLEPVHKVARVDLELLLGVDRSRNTLLENTRRFAHGKPANNALLWGARGMGKSSLVKAVHATIQTEDALEKPLLLIELAREDIATVMPLYSTVLHIAYRQDRDASSCARSEAVSRVCGPLRLKEILKSMRLHVNLMLLLYPLLSACTPGRWEGPASFGDRASCKSP